MNFRNLHQWQHVKSSHACWDVLINQPLIPPKRIPINKYVCTVESSINQGWKGNNYPEIKDFRNTQGWNCFMIVDAPIRRVVWKVSWITSSGIVVYMDFEGFFLDYVFMSQNCPGSNMVFSTILSHFIPRLFHRKRVLLVLTHTPKAFWPLT